MDEVAAARSGSIGAATAPPRIFTVRIWDEASGDVTEHRGEVREPATGAYRGFTRWDDLTSFITEQLATPPPRPRESR